MRIATWNLARPRPTGRRASALLGHIEAVRADVWVLTETHLRVSPGAGYRLIVASTGAPDRTPDERWTAIWAREGIEAAPVATGDAERAACARLVIAGGQALYVYGTVLPWLSDRRRHPLTGAAAFAAAVAEHAEDWRRIRSSEPHAGLCVLGDLNQDLRTSGHYYGSAAGRTALRSALVATDLTCMTEGDRDPVARLGGGRACIDHVCVAGVSLADGSDAVAWPAPEQVGRRLSDHHGIFIDLALAHAARATPERVQGPAVSGAA